MEKDELKIKCIKLKLHFIYCGIIFFAIAIALFTVRNYSNSDMAAQLSFGATLVGIVLSVIAIFMSIMGENNMTSTKDKLASVSDELIGITDNLNTSINTLKKVASITDEINNIKEQNNELYRELNSFQEMFQKSNLSNANDTSIDFEKLYNTVLNDVLRKNVLEVVYFSIKKQELNNTKPFNMFKTIIEYCEKYSSKDNNKVIYTLAGTAFIFINHSIKNNEFKNFILDQISIQQDIKNKVDEYFSNI